LNWQCKSIPVVTNQKPKSKPLSAYVNNSKSSSFLYTAGGSDWLLDQKASDQPTVRERKACCHCFKITYEPVASGYFFYCSK
jgi:hypothetical protein